MVESSEAHLLCPAMSRILRREGRATALPECKSGRHSNIGPSCKIAGSDLWKQQAGSPGQEREPSQAGDPVASAQLDFGRRQHQQDGGRGWVDRPGRQRQQHQEPDAAHAGARVADAAAQGAPGVVAPVGQERRQRGAAVLQAVVLGGQPLVNTGRHQRQAEGRRVAHRHGLVEHAGVVQGPLHQACQEREQGAGNEVAEHEQRRAQAGQGRAVPARGPRDQHRGTDRERQHDGGGHAGPEREDQGQLAGAIGGRFRRFLGGRDSGGTRGQGADQEHQPAQDGHQGQPGQAEPDLAVGGGVAAGFDQVHWGPP